jgi:hypothetical protein
VVFKAQEGPAVGGGASGDLSVNAVQAFTCTAARRRKLKVSGEIPICGLGHDPITI